MNIFYFLTSMRNILAFQMLFFFLFTGIYLDANGDNSFVYRFWNAIDGFPESYCQTVSLDSNGDIYVNHGTTSQMSVLDGYTLHNILNPQHHAKIHSDHSSQIWSYYAAPEQSILTGFQKYDSQKDEWIHYPILDFPPDLREIPVHANWDFLVLERKGSIIIFPHAGDLFEFNPVNGEMRSILLPDEIKLGNFQNVMSQSKLGSGWIGSPQGVLHITPPIGNETEWSFTEYCFPETLDIQNCLYLTETPEGNVFVSVTLNSSRQRGLLQLKDHNWDVVHITNEGLKYGWKDSEDRIWIGTDSNKWMLVENGLEEYIEDSQAILNGIVYTIFQESQTRTWLATNQGLVCIAHPTWKKPVPVSKYNSIIPMICEDQQGTLWFAGSHELLHLQDGNWEKIPFPENISLETRFPKNLNLLPDGQLAFITYSNELMLFHPVSREFQIFNHPTRQLRAIFPRSDNKIWVQSFNIETSSYYLEIFDGQNFNLFADQNSIPNLDHIRDIIQTDDHSVWIGHHLSHGPGLYKDNNYHYFGEEEGYTGSGAFSILENDNGRIWAGSRNSLFEFDGKRWQKILDNTGVIRSMIKGKNGDVWLASETGVYRYFKNSFTNITDTDGLSNNYVWTVFEDQTGIVWAGTSNGINRYYPENDIEPPNSFLPEFNNQKEFAPDGNAIFHFTGIDKWKYTDTSRLYYSYSIDSENWSEFTSNTSVTLQDLRPGNYQFRVRAMDRNWNIDETPALWDFEVILPWFMEPAFILLSFLSVGIIIGLAYMAINRHYRLLHSHKTLIEAHVQLKNTQTRLIETEKMASLGSLVSGVAHEINTPIGIGVTSSSYLDDEIQIFTKEYSQGELRRSSLEKFLEKINEANKMILNNLHRASDLIRSFKQVAVDQSNEEKRRFKVKEYIDDVLLSLKAKTKNTNITIEVECDDSIEINTYPGVISQVLTNFIMNSLIHAYHTGQTGCIRIMVSQKQNELILKYSDDGKGIPKDLLPKIFDPFVTTKRGEGGSGLGLNIVYNIITQKLNGIITCESQEGKGTVFNITLNQ